MRYACLGTDSEQRQSEGVEQVLRAVTAPMGARASATSTTQELLPFVMALTCHLER